VANSIVKFHDVSVRPPRGGWHYKLAGQRIEANSQSELIALIRNHQKNNGVYNGDAEIERQLWQYYCLLEPSRCSGSTTRQPRLEQPMKPVEFTPKFYGPIIWRFLNFAAVRFNPEFFNRLCDALVAMIDCPECRDEWREILASEPPASLTTSHDACKWVLRQHNRVNAKLGKRTYTYAEAVAQYAFPEQ
jgi:hypothetical protein